MKHFDRWDREQRPFAKGFLRSEVLFSRDNPNELRGVIHWDNARNYYANARRPEQDQWHRELVQLLERAPQWWDGKLASERRARATRTAAAPARRRAAAKPATRRRGAAAPRRRAAATASRRTARTASGATARRRPAAASSRR